MGKTIVQDYGPIYGEPVNGTVQGRPNGSVYVPSVNTISISLDEDYQYLKYSSATNVRYCDSSGTFIAADDGAKIVAVSQDLASRMKVSVYSDEELETVVATGGWSVGLFNVLNRTIGSAAAGLTDGQKLYVRAQLLNNDVPVATSNVIEVTMVVPE